MVKSRSAPSRIPVPRSFTVPTTPVPNTSTPSPLPTPRPKLERTHSTKDLRKIAALSVRLTCSTPTFNQSTKFAHLASAHHVPDSPMMQRGQGICNLWRYTDYKTTLAADEPTSPPSSSGSLSRKSSSLRLRLRRSINSLRSSSNSDGSSDGRSSRSSSPGPSPVLTEKELPPLPSLFSPCISPIDEYCHDSNFPPELDMAPPAQFKVRRKPAPEYNPNIALPTSASPSSSESSLEENDESEQSSSLQNVGPNVFIAYDDDSSFALATAFTHVIRIVSAGNVGSGILRAPRSDITFEPETGTHTLLLPIPQPVVPSSALDDISIAISDLAPISESHRDIEFVPPPRHKRFKIRRKPVPGGVPPTDSDSSSISSVGDIIEVPRQRAHPAISHADLVATQEFLAASGRIVSLQELAYFLFDGPASSDAPPLGLQATQIETALAFLRPHPFAPSARRRVLVMVPRGQLALEGLALMACYLAYAERCSVRFALRKFERSVGTVSKAWRGLLGNDGVIAAYLEELLLATQEAI